MNTSHKLKKGVFTSVHVQVLDRMNGAPLRAVILDNDETTGSYIIVVSIIRTIHKLGKIDLELFHYILERLASWMIRESIFRPDLIEFLKTLARLKKENKIDAVIMYTNQSELDSTLQNSLPRSIEYMFKFLVPDFAFDHILTRPENPTRINNVFPKQFKRVLDLYPYSPLDITEMLFFDDLALPMYVKDDGIKFSSESSWVLVDQYYRLLKKKDIINCVKFCFGDLVDCNFFTHLVIKIYLSYDLSSYKENSSPISCSYFTELVKKKYDTDGSQTTK